jgi:hypothetical protein
MAQPQPKQYKIVDKVGVVGFNGVIHKNGDVISAAEVPTANLKAWLRFGQIVELGSAPVSGATEDVSSSGTTKKGKQS